MKRVVTIVQRRGMEQVLPPKHKTTKPDCAHCRHSKIELVNGAFRFACKVLHTVMDAPHCEDFRDARKNLDHNYLRIA